MLVVIEGRNSTHFAIEHAKTIQASSKPPRLRPAISRLSHDCLSHCRISSLSLSESLLLYSHLRHTVSRRVIFLFCFRGYRNFSNCHLKSCRQKIGYFRSWSFCIPCSKSFIVSYLGVTPPISTAESNEREKEVTLTLMEELRKQGTFESEEEAQTRCVFSL